MNVLERQRDPRAPSGHRRSSGWVTATIFLAFAALVSAGAVSASPAEGSRHQTKVTIGFLNVEPAMQAAYAQARGYFARQGIDAELKAFADPSLIPAAVLSGEVQFSGFNVGGVANLKARGLPVKVVAAGALYRPDAPATALVAAPGKRVTTAQDLIGKRIGIDAKTTIAHIGLLKWLKVHGVSEGDVTIVEFRGFGNILGPLHRGQIEAAVLPEPYLLQATRDGARRVATVFDATCPTDCLITAWMARKDIDPTLAARFRNAIQAASVWANLKKNNAASGAILAKQASIDTASVKGMVRTTFSTRLRPGLAQVWIDAFAEFGVIPQSFAAIDLVK
jgi:NitT/TauT family transport system substrate-binding protein